MDISIHMIDTTIGNEWWKSIILEFVKPLATFEIRCWEDEFDTFLLAKKYGSKIENHETNEVVFRGEVSERMIDEIINAPKQQEREASNRMKMSKIFSFFVDINNYARIQSEHYGTEIYFINISEVEYEKLTSILAPLEESLRISVYSE